MAAPYSQPPTTSATLFYPLREGLALVAGEGVETERHRGMTWAFVELGATGIEMHVKNPGDRLWTRHTPRSDGRR